MLPSLLVSLVYGVVPIGAVLIGWQVIRKDYAPNADDASPPTTQHILDEED